MIFDCKASLTLPNTPVKFFRAKIAVGGHNGIYYIIVSFPSVKEKLNISNIASIHLSKSGTGATITFAKPPKVLTVDGREGGEELIPRFSRTVAALRRRDPQITQAVPPINELEGKLKHLPKILTVEGNNYEVKQLANNNLEKVVFSRTKLLPKGIFRLEFLKDLSIQFCNLDQFPDRLTNLKNTLTTLDISNNNLTKLDARLLTSLRHLSHLNLSHNKIKYLPIEIVSLRCLTFLDVSHNLLRHLPFTLGFLDKLRELKLSHNNLSYFPDSILRPPMSIPGIIRLRLDNFDISGNRTPTENLGFAGDRISATTPSLFDFSARAAIRWPPNMKLIQEWLPYTVYDYLQEYSAICGHCYEICVAHRSQIISIRGHYAGISSTVTSDATSYEIPIVAFYCCICSRKRI